MGTSEGGLPGALWSADRGSPGASAWEPAREGSSRSGALPGDTAHSLETFSVAMVGAGDASRQGCY